MSDDFIKLTSGRGGIFFVKKQNIVALEPSEDEVKALGYWCSTRLVLENVHRDDGVHYVRETIREILPKLGSTLTAPMTLREKAKAEAERDDIRNQSIDTLNLTVRSTNCLKNAGVFTIRDLLRKTEQELQASRNFGKKSVGEIKEKLESLGLYLAEPVRPEEWWGSDPFIDKQKKPSDEFAPDEFVPDEVDEK